jgi:hypothetical protein
MLAALVVACGSSSNPGANLTGPAQGGSGTMYVETAPGGSVSTGTNVSGGTPPANKPPCISNPSDVTIIGDSYVTGFFSPTLQSALAALDPMASQFRNYAVAGTSLATGGFGTIPPQFDQAVSANPVIKFSIMDGGGNDILLCDAAKFPACDTTCSTTGSSTKKVCIDIVNTAAAAAHELMAKMANAGVKDIIYFFYPRLPAKGGGYKEILDYAEPLAKSTCDSTAAMTDGKLTCHFVDLAEPFQAAGGDMNPANFSVLDGVHPSQAGQDIAARQIWTTMQNDCLGQSSSSGCCSP